MDSTAQKTDLKAIPANVNEIKLQPTSLDIWENKYLSLIHISEPTSPY